MQKIIARIALLFALFPLLLQAELRQSTDLETRLVSWKLVEQNFELEIIQRLPDQTRAFFQARGFPTKTADQIATHCVFQTIARNTATGPEATAITIELADWRIKQQGKTRPVKLKEDWLAEWKTDPHISNKAKIAFRWATLPTAQTYQPGGDYNWGMVSFGPGPGDTFDLKASWKTGQENHSRWITSIQCPTDR